MHPAWTAHDPALFTLCWMRPLATLRIDFEDTVSAARVESIVADLEGAIQTRFPEIRHLFLAAK
jgi:hypothetical protein